MPQADADALDPVIYDWSLRGLAAKTNMANQPGHQERFDHHKQSQTNDNDGAADPDIIAN